MGRDEHGVTLSANSHLMEAEAFEKLLPRIEGSALVVAAGCVALENELKQLHGWQRVNIPRLPI
jgi:hypothetical protein